MVVSSVYVRDAKSIEDYVARMNETFAARGLAAGVNLVGMSYGAWQRQAIFHQMTEGHSHFSLFARVRGR